jgi:hypothetical protein
MKKTVTKGRRSRERGLTKKEKEKKYIWGFMHIKTIDSQREMKRVLENKCFTHTQKTR